MRAPSVVTSCSIVTQVAQSGNLGHPSRKPATRCVSEGVRLSMSSESSISQRQPRRLQTDVELFLVVALADASGYDAGGRPLAKAPEAAETGLPPRLLTHTRLLPTHGAGKLSSWASLWI